MIAAYQAARDHHKILASTAITGSRQFSQRGPLRTWPPLQVGPLGTGTPQQAQQRIKAKRTEFALGPTSTQAQVIPPTPGSTNFHAGHHPTAMSQPHNVEDKRFLAAKILSQQQNLSVQILLPLLQGWEHLTP